MVPEDVKEGEILEHVKTGETYRFVRWGPATEICDHPRPVTVRRTKEGAMTVCFPAVELWAPR